MTGMQILQALENPAQEYLEECEKTARPHYIRWIAAAACLCVLLAVGVPLYRQYGYFPGASTPATTVAESSFTPNEQTRRMLKRINDRRSYLDRKLREGNVIFFGVRYPTVSVEPRLVRSLLAVLPEAMREANDGAQLFAVLRSKGVNYLNREICDELVENRQDYLQIIEHRKEMEKNDELQNLLGTVTRSSR